MAEHHLHPPSDIAGQTAGSLEQRPVQQLQQRIASVAQQLQSPKQKFPRLQQQPRQDLAQSPRLSSPGAAAYHQQHLEPLERCFLRCPVHPEEPLNYFCVDCQSDCICAECVLRGEHQNHSVQCVREAVRQLPLKVQGFVSAVRVRGEALNALAARTRERRYDVAEAVSAGQQDLKEALLRVSAALHEEERQLLQEVERCSSDVAEILGGDDEAHIVEAYDMLSKFHQLGDVVQALNWYARLNQALKSCSATPPLGGSELVKQLKSQLCRGFESRLTVVHEVMSRVDALKPPGPGLLRLPKESSGAAGGSIRRAEARPPLPPTGLPCARSSRPVPQAFTSTTRTTDLV